MLPETEGIYEVRGNDGEAVQIDVYEHPELGLCIWFPQDSQSIEFDFGGHVAISRANLDFLKRIGDLDNHEHNF